MDQFQEEYIRQEQLHRRRVKAVRRMLLVLLLALWELCTRLNIIDGFIFSSPSRVLFCLAGMIRDGSIWEHLGITLFETIVSFLLVTGIGIFMAVILWSSRTLAEILEPYLVMLNSLPNAPPRRSEPLRYKVGGASKPSPYFAGWDRQAVAGGDLMLLQSPRHVVRDGPPGNSSL